MDNFERYADVSKAATPYERLVRLIGWWRELNDFDVDVLNEKVSIQQLELRDLHSFSHPNYKIEHSDDWWAAAMDRQLGLLADEILRREGHPPMAQEWVEKQMTRNLERTIGVNLWQLGARTQEELNS